AGKPRGMEVVTWSPNMTPDRASAHGVIAAGLDEPFRSADIVSPHLVPTPATRHLLNAARLALMKPDSVLVNPSRSGLIDTDALTHALSIGQVGFCALDVFDQEPLRADHPLLSLPNALLTPHHGFVCKEVMETFA